MGGLQHHHRAHTGTGQSVDRREHVQPPVHGLRVQLMFGQPRDRRQASRPAVVVEFVHDELVRGYVTGHPRGIREDAAVAHSQA
jgi:hypothetical protein